MTAWSLAGDCLILRLGISSGVGASQKSAPRVRAAGSCVPGLQRSHGPIPRPWSLVPTAPIQIPLWKGGNSPALGRSTFLRRFVATLFLLPQKIRSVLRFPLPGFSSETSWGLSSRSWGPPGPAAVRADCVSQERVPPLLVAAGRAGPRWAAWPLQRREARLGRGGGGRSLGVRASGEGQRAGVGTAGPGPRVPFAAPSVLSGLGRGDVKGCRGPGVGLGTGAAAGRHRVASVLPPSGVGGQTGTMWRPKLSA